ncbi:2Fe-2S iron-sulfur cluster-binding protein [Pantoea sp. Mhis]|uniref:2Fe-2S iron-sulfur cluster-binding protein n=1 Tax=Pantoea sp. Mhis TaxID=2576759 RepID=UPI00351B3F6B
MFVPYDNYHMVVITYLDKKFFGNNQQILLEQLEIQGFNIPYSCRAGICGICKLALIAGRVRKLTEHLIYRDNIILCCSCIPESDINLIEF